VLPGQQRDVIALCLGTVPFYGHVGYKYAMQSSSERIDSMAIYQGNRSRAWNGEEMSAGTRNNIMTQATMATFHTRSLSRPADVATPDIVIKSGQSQRNGTNCNPPTRPHRTSSFAGRTATQNVPVTTAGSTTTTTTTLRPPAKRCTCAQFTRNTSRI